MTENENRKQTTENANNLPVNSPGSGMANDEKRNLPTISAQDLMSTIQQSKKATTGGDILRLAMTKDGDLHMKANINNPFGYALVHANANLLEKRGFNSTAAIDRDMVNLAEQFGVSKKGDRVKDVLHAAVSVMKQEFEIEKTKARALMGRTQ